MYSRRLLQPRTVWYHPKTQAYYLVLSIIDCSTNGHEHEQSVHYWSFARRAEKYRDVTEFLDGRFIPLDASMTPISPGQIPPPT